MLQTSTIEPGTFSLLKKLMELPCLKNFYLVGGTALALKYGHRLSVDIDLFGGEDFEKQTIITALTEVFGERFIDSRSRAQWAIFCYIDDVKVDIINYKHPCIREPEVFDNIRVYNDLDILAMKVNAILGRGKKKDFWDLAELFKYYTVTECIEAYDKKFPTQQLLISIPNALTYFADAEESEEPVSLQGQTWPAVKKSIQQKVNEYLK